MLKNNFMSLVAALALCAAAPAFGANWQLVDATGKAQIEVDLGSLVKKDGAVTGWVQHTFAKLTTTQTGAYFVYRTMKEQLRHDCAQQTSTILVRGYFDDDGSEIAVINGTGATRTVMPDTPEQRVLTRMCNPTADFKPARARAATPPPAALANVSPRAMDGPPPAARKAGIVLAKAESHDAPPAAAAIAKPADKAVDKADPKPVDKPIAKPEAAAPAAAEKAAPAAVPAPVAHAKAAPHAAAHPPAAPKAAAASNESRDMVVARVLRARAGAPQPAEPVVRPRAAHGAGTAHAANAQAHEAHWDYEGENAPYRWGDIKSENLACKAGTRQSPIDIRNPVVSEVEPIRFFYEDVPLKVTNNGHTIQVDYAPGSFIMFGGARYELLQFHFHTPSEERINGRSFDMVVHLVHKSAQGRLAVVAVLLSAGREQAMLQTIWNAMPGTRDRTRERLDVSINARQLLPAEAPYYSYMGSLTTPPCTEGVQWLVMKTPVEMSRDQIAHFTALYPMNARPLQALNDRLIKVGR